MKVGGTAGTVISRKRYKIYNLEQDNFLNFSGIRQKARQKRSFFMVKPNLENLKIGLWQSKGFIFVLALSLFLFCASVFGVENTQSKDKVLGASKARISPTPTPGSIDSPINLVGQLIQPSPILTSAPTPAPTMGVVNNNYSSPTPTITPTPTSVPSPSPTPVELNVKILIDYTGKKSQESYSISIFPHQTAWEAVVSAIGIDNINYTDYGGDFGKFITGFNGISADPNSEFYEFRVNGVSSSVGVSAYECMDGDVLDFILTTF